MRRRDLLFVLAVLASAAACSGSAEAPGRQQRERGRLDPLQGLAGRAAEAPSAPIGGQPANNLASRLPPDVERATGGPEPSSTMPNRCAGLRAEADVRLLPVDIVWAIDTSGSMVSSFPAIQQALNRFAQVIEAAGIDVHIVLVSGANFCVPPPLGSGECGSTFRGPGGGPRVAFGMPDSAPDSRTPRFLHLDVSFGFGLGMGVLLDSFPYFKHMLRPDARTHLVLTEDGPPAVTPQAVVDHVEGRASATLTEAWAPGLTPGTWVFSGVICPPGSLCGLIPPETTIALIDMTGGVLADLNQAGVPGADPFSALLEELATQVTVGAELSCEYDIPNPPEGETFDHEKVNVLVGTKAGQMELVPRARSACDGTVSWNYDDEAAPTKVVLCPAACDHVRSQAEATLAVEFGCETELVPLL